MTLVLLHGLGPGARMWQPQIDRLRTDFHLLAPDLPGLAGSVAAGPFTLERAAEAVEALIQSRAHAQVHLCGLSLGAMVALAVAGRGRVALRSLTVSGAQVNPPRLLAAIQLLLLRLLPVTALAAQLERLIPASDPEMRSAVRADLAATGKPGILAAAGTLMASDLRSLLPQIRIPTLVLNGAHDRPSQPAAATLLRALPHATLALVPDAGHFVSYERADAFTTAWRSFVERVEATPVQVAS